MKCRHDITQYTIEQILALPRWRGWIGGEPMPAGPFVADIHSFDIPPTIAAAVRNCPEDCVAVVLVDRGGPDMRIAAEAAAAESGRMIIWEDRVRAAGTMVPNAFTTRDAKGNREDLA